MTGQKDKATAVKGGRRVAVVCAVAGFLTVAAAAIIIIHYARRGPAEAKAGNVVAGPSSSAVVQGGRVENLTVYNGPPAPQASPAAPPQDGHAQTPPAAPPVNRPTPESSPAPRPRTFAVPQAPPTSRPPDEGRAAFGDTAAPRTAEPNAYRRCGVEFNRDGEIALNSGWSVKSLSFFARYTAAGTEEKQSVSIYFFSGASDGTSKEPEEPKKPFLMAFRVPGEEREERDIAVYPDFAREFEADGCFYTFTVTHVSERKIGYSFRASGPLRPVAGP